MEKTFEGSVPAFIAAFTRRRRLSEADLEEIREMLDKMAEGKEESAMPGDDGKE